jgi:hypothetical protein
VNWVDGAGRVVKQMALPASNAIGAPQSFSFSLADGFCLVMVIFAPTTTAPAGSRTVPETVPSPVSAPKRRAVLRRGSSSQRMREIMLCCCCSHGASGPSYLSLLCNARCCGQSAESESVELDAFRIPFCTLADWFGDGLGTPAKHGLPHARTGFLASPPEPGSAEESPKCVSTPNRIRFPLRRRVPTRSLGKKCIAGGQGCV